MNKILSNLMNTAQALDKSGYYDQADSVTELMVKVATYSIGTHDQDTPMENRMWALDEEELGEGQKNWNAYRHPPLEYEKLPGSDETEGIFGMHNETGPDVPGPENIVHDPDKNAVHTMDEWERKNNPSEGADKLFTF